MENDMYNQNEIKFFTDVYNYLKTSLKTDTTGNISAQDTHDFLIVSSQLSKDVIYQIGDITGGSAQGWYGEKQLFLALKLVAAAQQRIPITSQIPLLEIDLPLPDLFINNNTEYDLKSPIVVKRKEPSYSSSPNLIHLSDSDCPPLKGSDNGYQIMISEDVEDEFPPEGVYSEPTSNFTSQSPSVSSPASDSPTPTNSGHDKHWNKPIDSHWHIIVNEEHHQLLGTEEESSDRHSSEGKDEEEPERERVTEAVEEDGEEDDDEVWTITEEQQQYYTRQFMTMQPDLSAFLPGNVAKQFFEKSKLPVSELRQIWQLADVSRDGALSLEEFFAAMHLVVLRRNKIPLPDKLPKALMPKSFRWTKFLDSPTSTLSSPGPKPVNFDFHKSQVEKDPKILHPRPVRVTPEGKRLELGEETPLPSSTHHQADGDLSTPPHREPYYMSFKPNSSSYQDDCLPSAISHQKHKALPTKANLETSQPLRLTEENSSGSRGPTSLPPFSPQPSAPPSNHPPLPNKDLPPPPPPPPRPSRTHVRSSSLDLNKFNKFQKGMAQKSPPPPPRPPHTMDNSPNTALTKKQNEVVGLSSWDPSMIGGYCAEEDLSSATSHLRSSSSSKHSHSSAFEVYKKPFEETAREQKKPETVDEEDREVEDVDVDDENRDDEDDDDDDDDDVEDQEKEVENELHPPPPPLSNKQSDKREMLASLQTLKEKNAVLLRVNSELNQELAEVIEERISLEFQLEQMKSFAS